MTQASPDHPGLGDMEAVRTFATAMRTRSDELKTMTENVSTAASDVGSPDTLQGFTAIVWTARATQLKRAVGQIRTVLEDRHTAAHTYVSEVERISSEASAIWEERGAALKNLVYWQQSPLEYRNSWEGQQRHWLIQNTLNTTRGKLNTLYEDREAADRTFADALDNGVTILGQPATTLAGIGAQLRGFLTPRDIEVAEAIAATEELAANPGDEELLRRVQSELADLGDDQRAWERFYRLGGGVTGETLTRAIDSVSTLWNHGMRDADDPEVIAGVDVATMLRDGLSRASTNWSPATAGNFADSLFSPVEHDLDIDPATVAFLFNSPEGALMGSALTLAAAGQVDRLERTKGRSMDGVLPNASMPMQHLSAHVNGFDNFAASDTDAAAQVFYSLAMHPDAALEFLTGEGVNVEEGVGRHDGVEGRDDRVTYWYGIRDWQYDHYEAPLALLEGMQHAEGGVLSTDVTLGNLTDAQRDTITAQNEVLTSAFEQIAWSGHSETGWSPHAMSDTADGILLQTVENHQLLIGLSTVMLEGGGGIVDTNGQLTILGNPDLTIPHLELDKSTLGQTLARIEDVEAARESLAGIGADFSNSMGVLLSSGQVDPLKVIDATTEMWAFADGAAAGIAVENGQNADEQVTMLIDMGSQGAGKLVGWAVGEIPLVGGIANDVIVAPSIDYVTGVVTGNVATQEDVALDEAAQQRANEVAERADPQVLLDLYENSGDHWLGNAYRDSEGQLDPEAFDAHVRHEASRAANGYGTATGSWIDYISERDDAVRNRNEP